MIKADEISRGIDGQPHLLRVSTLEDNARGRGMLVQLEAPVPRQAADKLVKKYAAARALSALAEDDEIDFSEADEGIKTLVEHLLAGELYEEVLGFIWSSS